MAVILRPSPNLKHSVTHIQWEFIFMRAITLKHFGDPDVLVVSERPIPTPEANQLLVRVKASALNRADLLQRRGKYPPPPGESDILGLEIAGEVAALGADVTNFNVGDRVCGLVGGGAYAEYCLIDHKVAMPIPTHLSFTEAAAIPEAFLTANEAIFTLGNLQQNDSILIHAGGSGVGSAGIQLAHQVNARVFTTIGSPEKMEKVKRLHPEKIINYKQQDFAIEIPEGVHVIIDFIGASYLSQNLHTLKPNGRLVCVGLMGGSKTEIDLSRVQTLMLQIKGLRMRTRSLAEKREITQRFQERWLPLFQDGKLTPVIDSVFEFENVKAAHQHMESNANVGKIVLTIP